MKALLLKFKVYIVLIVIILIFAGISYYQKKAIDRKDAKIVRLSNNMDGLLQENADYLILNLTLKEASKASSLEVDSLSRLLKIRPKTIERIITKTIIHIDTVPVYIPVVQKTDTSWVFFDVADCFEYRGQVTKVDEGITVKRISFLYTNKMIDTFFWYRSWFLGKKKYTQETKATCGSAYTKDITIVKK